MSQYRTLNQFVLVKKEGTPGADASPTPGANAVLVENPDFSPVLNTQETNEVTGSLDARAPIPTSGSRQGSFKHYLSGSGTAGTAPRWQPLMEGCSFAMSTLAADVTGTAQAGASGSITLASGASSTDNFYLGMVIQLTGGTGATGSPLRIITGYNGTTKVATVSPAWGVTPDNTTTYAIRKGNLFQLQSAVLPSLTMYRYQPRADGASAKLDKMIGAAGNAKLTLGVGGGCYIDYDFKGSLTAVTDPSVPTAPTYDPTRPPPFINGQVYLGNNQVLLNNFSLDPGIEVTLEEDPNQQFGYGLAGITRRKVGGSFRLPKDVEANLDAMASWQLGTEYQLTALWGSAAGNRFAFMSQHMVLTGVKDADVNGFAYRDLNYRTNGQDTGFFLYAY